ncbi:MAG: DUF3329 domain-containing protein [Fusobacteriaceae bacterium]
MKELFRKKSTGILLIVTLIAIFLLNHFSHLTYDEYMNSFVRGTWERVENISTAIRSNIKYYKVWGGRTQFFVQLFLLMPKIIYNIINSIVFILMLIMTYINLGAEFKKKNIFTSLLVIIMISWFGIANFGETTLWISSSINYMWWATLLMFFTYYSKKLINNKISVPKNNLLFVIVLIIFGFSSGWTNENMVVAIGLTSLIYWFFNRKIIFVDKLTTKFFIILYVAFGAGAAFLLLAPGNFIRSQVTKERIVIPTTYIGDLLLLLRDAWFVWTVLFVSIIILLICKRNLKEVFKKNYYEISVFFFATAVMKASPWFPERAGFGIISYAIIFTSNFALEAFHEIQNRKINFFKIFNSLVIISLIAGVGYAIKEFMIYDKQQKERHIILSQKFNSIEIVPSLKVKERHLSPGQFMVNKWLTYSMEPFYGKQKIYIVERYLYDNMYLNNNIATKFTTFYSTEPQTFIKDIFVSKEKNQVGNTVFSLNLGGWDKDQSVFIEGVELYPAAEEIKKLKKNQNFVYGFIEEEPFKLGSRTIFQGTVMSDITNFDKIIVTVTVNQPRLQPTGQVVMTKEVKKIVLIK